jgi:hypothetical protein
MPDFSRAQELYYQIESEGHLEDRREYDKDMLQTMYQTDEYTAERLYDMIQNDFYPDRAEPLEGAITDLYKFLRVKDIGGNNLSKEGYARLGAYIHDYLTSAVYDMNWEGFNDVQLHGIKFLLRDMAIGAEAEAKHNTYGEGTV